MNYTEMVDLVADRCNVNNDEARIRIGVSLNERYKQVCSTVGVNLKVERTTKTATTTISQRTLVFGTLAAPVDKILNVYDNTVTPPRFLDERPYEEIKRYPSNQTPATQYAIETMGARQVTILLNATPATAYVLTADVLQNMTILSGLMIPAFSEDFHDILTEYAMGVEYGKKEKQAKETACRNNSKERLAELRLHMAVSTAMAVYPGILSDRQTIPNLIAE